jgi:tetratricopeptide (TPR) repeat protein
MLLFCICTICFAKNAQHVDSDSERLHAKIAELSKILQKNPNDYQSEYRRAMCYLQLHDYPSAISDFTKSIEVSRSILRSNSKPGVNKSPTLFYLAISYQNRGSTYLRMDEYQKGVHDLTRAIDIRPSYAPNYKTRAMILEKLGDLTGAKADYEKYNGLVYSKQLGLNQEKR